MGRPTDRDSDSSDDAPVGTVGGDDTEKVEGLHSLVGVPDPGGFGVELGASDGSGADLLTCLCRCPHHALGPYTRHSARCCGQEIEPSTT